MKILVVDDEKNIRETLVKILGNEGWSAAGSENGLSAQRMLLEEPFDLVVTDLKMPGLDGLGLMKWCREEGPAVPFIMISAHGEIQDAVQAMKDGALDYLTKPFNPDELILRIRNARDVFLSRRRPEATENQEGFDSLSPGLKKLFAQAKKAALTPSLLLITGESGTGKEVLARQIHRWSPWASGPFIPINIGGVPENLLESELFGYEKGAFTGADRKKNGLFELAAGGTLFLDEIGEMPLVLQVKLLRVLQDRKIQRLGGTVSLPVQARILAATNRDLKEEVRAGRFREDLFYRLNVVPLHLPPLRDRLEDLPGLCQSLLEKLCQNMGRKAQLSGEALAALGKYDFPGNIRELENLLERALIFAEGEVLGPQDLELPVLESSVQSLRAGTLREAERNLIQDTLLKWEGNQTKSAEELGIARRTLFSKIKEYGLESALGGS